jgi:hypothetical protein
VVRVSFFSHKTFDTTVLGFFLIDWGCEKVYKTRLTFDAVDGSNGLTAPGNIDKNKAAFVRIRKTGGFFWQRHLLEECSL